MIVRQRQGHLVSAEFRDELSDRTINLDLDGKHCRIGMSVAGGGIPVKAGTGEPALNHSIVLSRLAYKIVDLLNN